MLKQSLNINTVGLGFVGLVTTTVLASKGFEINALETNKKKLSNIKINKIDFFEPNLNFNLKKYKKRIHFLNKEKILEDKINVIFICVGTPTKKNGIIDLRNIYTACKKFKKYKKEKIILVIKSTVLPGTIDKIKKKFFINNKNINFCSNPEFLREGSAYNDFIKSEKIVLGVDNNYTIKIMVEIYKSFNSTFIYTNFVTAEFIKYLSNNLLACMISFSNFMSLLSFKIKNIDIKKAFDSVKLDKRWFGSPALISSYFHPGIGYGGSCLPKDVNALANFSKKFFKKNNLLNNVSQINSRVTNQMVSKAKKKFKDSKCKKIIFLGVSFKPGSDDIRNSKSLEFIRKFIKGFDLNYQIHDEIVTNINLNNKNKKVAKLNLNINRDYFYVLLTPWPKYINFLKKISKKNIFDGKHII